MLNISKGNMYNFVTYTWNTVKGKCSHDCLYCYMKRWGELKPLRFDEKELKTDLGSGNFIFVGSSNDMFAENVPEEMIIKTLEHCRKYSNKYLFQTKNTKRINDYKTLIPKDSIICTTIETNRYDHLFMGKAPTPLERATAMRDLDMFKRFVTIEPIMDFDLEEFVLLLSMCKAEQINIGADSGNNNLPEPSKEKIEQLVIEIQKFTKIENKRNLARLTSPAYR